MQGQFGCGENTEGLEREPARSWGRMEERSLL